MPVLLDLDCLMSICNESKVLEARVDSTLIDFIRNKIGEDEFAKDVHNHICLIVGP